MRLSGDGGGGLSVESAQHLNDGLGEDKWTSLLPGDLVPTCI